MKTNFLFIFILIVFGIVFSSFIHSQGGTFKSLFKTHYCPGCHNRIWLDLQYVKQCPHCGYTYYLYKEDIKNGEAVR